MQNSMLVFYAQRKNVVAKKALLQNHKNLIYKICKKYFHLYPYILVWEEIENSSMQIFNTSVQKFSNKYKATFATFLSLQLKYYFSTITRQAFTNKQIVSTFAIKKDYTEYSDNILGSEKYNPHEKVMLEDLYRRYLNYLNKEEKELILLWSQSFSYKEISELKNKKTKWVDNKITQIIKKLRKFKV